MKILFAPSVPWISGHNNFIAGAEPNPLRLYELLSGQGITSTFVDPNSYPWNPFAGKDTLLQSIDPVRALRITMRERDVDAVVSVFEGAATSLGILRKLFRFEAAIVQWDIGLTNWRLRNKIIDFTLPRIDKLLVLGRNQIEYIKDNYAACPDIAAVGHYVDADFYRPASLEHGGFILTVGDDIGRDFSTLIKATQSISRQLVIKAGRHPPGVVHSQTRLIRNRISHIELRDLYVKSAVVVVPTLTTPNACGVSSILEASATGRPLVVTDNPGIRDFVVPNETCLMVPPNDSDALMDAINHLLCDPHTCRRLADGARAFVETHCTQSAFASRFGRALRETVENRLLSRRQK